MIHRDQLARMQDTVEQSFNSTCVRRRFDMTTLDRFNNPVRGAPTDVTYACRKVPAPGNEDTTDRAVQTSEAGFLLPHDADVEATDVLIHEGDTWEVIGPTTGQSWETHLRVLVRRSEASAG